MTKEDIFAALVLLIAVVVAIIMLWVLVKFAIVMVSNRKTKRSVVEKSSNVIDFSSTLKRQMKGKE